MFFVVVFLTTDLYGVKVLRKQLLVMWLTIKKDDQILFPPNLRQFKKFEYHSTKVKPFVKKIVFCLMNFKSLNFIE